MPSCDLIEFLSKRFGGLALHQWSYKELEPQDGTFSIIFVEYSLTF